MTELRDWFHALTASLARDGALAPGWDTRDAAQMLWAQVSVQHWGLLVHDCRWPPAKARNRMIAAARSMLLVPS